MKYYLLKNRRVSSLSVDPRDVCDTLAEKKEEEEEQCVQDNPSKGGTSM